MMRNERPGGASVPIGLLAIAGIAFWWATSQGGNADNHVEALEKKRCVLVIGIDGLRSDGLTTAHTPNLDAIAATGAITYNAFAGGEPGTPTQQITSSGPGWASILTGVWTNKHRVRDNSFGGSRLLLYPHFFKFIKEARPNAVIASFINWEEIGTEIVDPVGEYFDYRFPDGALLPSTYVERDKLVLSKVEDYLVDQSPDAMFVYFGNVDIAGHSSGFTPSNSAYLSAIETVDEQIGNVLQAIRDRPAYADEEWMIVISTDHGGLGTGHGGQSPGERTIFMIASGEGIKPRVHEVGPGHTAVPPTAMRHLGIPIDPDWGWEAEPFGYPPYCPAQLTATADSRFGTVALAWSPAEGFDLSSQELLRDGEVIATLAPTDSTFIDAPPLALANDDQQEIAFRYTLQVTGTDASQCDPLTANAAFYSGPVDYERVVNVTFNGELTDASGTLPAPAAINLIYSRDNDRNYLELPKPGPLYFNRPDALQFSQTRDFTVSFLTKVTTTSGALGTLIGNRSLGGSTFRGWAIGVTRNGELQWQVADVRDGKQFRSQDPLLADGRWHHVSVTHDRDGVATIYVDGIVIGREDISEIGSINAGDFQIGGRLTGAIDDLQVWQRRLLPHEIRTLSASADVNHPPFYDAVTDLRFDDDFGNATATGAASIDDSGVRGGSASLSNTDLAQPTYLSLGDDAALTFGIDQDFTTSVWVKSTGEFGLGGTKSDPAILSNKNWRNGASTGWAIATAKDGRWQWNIGDGDNAHRVDYDSTAGAIIDGQWHHIAVTHDRDQIAALYFDGVEVTQRDISEVGDLNSGLPTAIGTDGMLGADWPAWFNGNIDNVQIWRRALSAQEIAFVFDHFSTSLEQQPAIQLEITEITRHGNYAAISYSRPPGGFGQTAIDYTVSGLRYSIEQSPSLTEESWLSLAPADFDLLPTATLDNQSGETITLQVPVSGETARHFRLKTSAE
ncbi:MAG: hypothetical protein ACI9R3_002743 [Verrucomicrobiales bacterium]|jgi:hypothetical protein